MGRGNRCLWGSWRAVLVAALLPAWGLCRGGSTDEPGDDDAGVVDPTDADILAGFTRLWQMVVKEQMSRIAGAHAVGPLDIRHACLFGLDATTLAVAGFLLSAADPPVDSVEVHDAPASGEFMRLSAAFGGRVTAVKEHNSSRAAWSESRPTCDLVLFSEASPRFTIDRVLPRLEEHVVVSWISGRCPHEKGEKASPTCHLLNTMWEKTVLMRLGYCMREVCMSRVPTRRLHDPNTLPLGCDAGGGAVGFTSSRAESSVTEFGQDWFLLRNLFPSAGDVGRDAEPRVYVDVGASLPYEYSNTVFLDRCLGWRGVCVEPNPHLANFLEAYRTCEVFPNCAGEAVLPDKGFTDHEGTPEFTATCLPMNDVLTKAGLAGKRIDILSIDVEHGELGVLQGLDLASFDIRVILVEVSRGVRWLEVDTAILPMGYAKVAILGRDTVYVKLGELRSRADWQFLADPAADRVAMPDTWAAFHQRVVDEETEAEQIAERAAFYAGLRRR